MQSEESRRIFEGSLWVVMAHALTLILCMVVYYLGLVRTDSVESWAVKIPWLMTLLLGLTQLLYVVPLCLWLKRKRRFATLKGVMLAAIATLLLNGGCYLLPGTFSLLFL